MTTASPSGEAACCCSQRIEQRSQRAVEQRARDRILARRAARGTRAPPRCSAAPARRRRAARRRRPTPRSDARRAPRRPPAKRASTASSRHRVHLRAALLVVHEQRALRGVAASARPRAQQLEVGRPRSEDARRDGFRHFAQQRRQSAPRRARARARSPGVAAPAGARAIRDAPLAEWRRQRAIGRMRFGGACEQRGERLARRRGRRERVRSRRDRARSRRACERLACTHVELEDAALEIDDALEHARAARRRRLDHDHELRAARIRRRHERRRRACRRASAASRRAATAAGAGRARCRANAAGAARGAAPCGRPCRARAASSARIAASAGVEIGPGEREFLAGVGRDLEQPVQDLAVAARASSAASSRSGSPLAGRIASSWRGSAVAAASSASARLTAPSPRAPTSRYGARPPDDRQHHQLGHFVGVQRAQPIGERRHAIRARLDHEQHFRVVLHDGPASGRSSAPAAPGSRRRRAARRPARARCAPRRLRIGRRREGDPRLLRQSTSRPWVSLRCSARAKRSVIPAT